MELDDIKKRIEELDIEFVDRKAIPNEHHIRWVIVLCYITSKYIRKYQVIAHSVHPGPSEVLNCKTLGEARKAFEKKIREKENIIREEEMEKLGRKKFKLEK